MNELLKCVMKAPLKPQQRIKVLQTFLIPRFIHKLVFGKLTRGVLRRIDKLVRKMVRSWCRLPHDIPTSYFYAPVREGGLGIMSFASKIPEMLRNRLSNLRKSGFPAAVEASKSSWAQSKRKWSLMTSLKDKDWANKLHKSTDGFELRQVKDSPLSYKWFDDPYIHTPTRDWVQFVRLHINTLPSRMRIS